MHERERAWRSKTDAQKAEYVSHFKSAPRFKYPMYPLTNETRDDTAEQGGSKQS